MKLANWHWAVLVFSANLLVMWLFGPTRPETVRAAAPPFPPPPRPVFAQGSMRNYVPLWLGNNLLGDSLIYQNGNRVGIGTTTPGATLEVNGPAKFDGAVNFSGGLSVPASGLTGIVQIANGGTGISDAPSADGQYLRGNADGTWSVSTIQTGDIPSTRDTLTAFSIAPLFLEAPCPPGDCTPNSAALSFPIITQDQGWTASGSGNTTFTATDPGLLLGFVSVSAFTAPSINPTVLTIELDHNGSPIPAGTFTISTPSGVTQPTAITWPFLLQVVAGDTFTAQASCGPSGGALCQVNQNQITLIMFK